MARPRKMHVGMMLEIAQMASLREPVKVWLPFIVTHLYDGNVVSGVAFSGEPGALGWMNRGAQTFDHVEKGNAGRMWRFPGDVGRTGTRGTNRYRCWYTTRSGMTICHLTRTTPYPMTNPWTTRNNATHSRSRNYC